MGGVYALTEHDSRLELRQPWIVGFQQLDFEIAIPDLEQGCVIFNLVEQALADGARMRDTVVLSSFPTRKDHCGTTRQGTAAL